MKNETWKKNADGQMELVSSEAVDLYTDIESFKAAFRSFIDNQTQAAIFEGFTFDGVVFSMSINAQINWSNFPVLPSQLFPLPINGKNDEPYTLAESNKMNFYFTALGFKNGLLQSGSAKKNQVNAAETIEQLKVLADEYNFSY